MEARDGAGLLIHWGNEIPAKPSFLGSCFAFRDARTYLTAGHCVPEGPINEMGIYVMRPGRGGMRQVVTAHRHPTADLASLDVNPVAGGDEPFWSSEAPCEAGDDFVAFGFPEETINGIAGTPTARVFKGNVQRLFHEGDGAHLAAELSCPAPAGLSGGAVLNASAASEMLPMAVVISNRESDIYVARYENDETIRSVTRYGTALVLEQFHDWLGEPRIPGERRDTSDRSPG